MYYFCQKSNPTIDFFSWLKYKFQLRCSFILSPRYLTCVIHGIYWPLTLKLSCFVVFVMFLSDLSLNSKILNLLVFTDILFALSHVVRSFKSWLICLFIVFKEFSRSGKLVSSEKWCTLLNSMAWVRSLMHIKKSSGPRNEPCGTPSSIKALSDVWPLTVTCCFPLVR